MCAGTAHNPQQLLHARQNSTQSAIATLCTCDNWRKDPAPAAVCVATPGGAASAWAGRRSVLGARPQHKITTLSLLCSARGLIAQPFVVASVP